MRCTRWSSLRAWWSIALFALSACGIPVKSQILEKPSFGTAGGPQNGCEREAFIGTALTSAAAEAVLPDRSQERIGPNLIKYTQADLHGGAASLGYGLYRVSSKEPIKLSKGLRIVSPGMADSHDHTPEAQIRARLDRQAMWGTWVFVGLAVTTVGAGLAIAGVTSESGGLVGPGLAVMAGGLTVTFVGTFGAMSNRVMSPTAASRAVVDDVVSTHSALPSVVDQYNLAVRARCQPATARPTMSSTTSPSPTSL